MSTWIYILYAFVFCLALRHLFRTNVPLYRIALLPLIVAFLAWWNFNLACAIHMHGIWVWLLSAGIGLIQSLISHKKLGIKADKQHWQIEIPGTWSILGLGCLLFGLEQIIYFISATSNPALKADVFIILVILASGWTGGMVIGKHLNYFYKFYQAGHTQLKKN
jgi:hypothetical protein